ncbi:MAG: hypothetical protein AB7G47_19780 [Mycolicibacterium sp.]|uniref:hypothetical protein n=1 Tax=Mycolicibacterium sp. TaxID=2320850 RepID=UPI003D12C0DE
MTAPPAESVGPEPISDDSHLTPVLAVCRQCHTNVALRGGTVCGACHPLSPHDAYRLGLCRDCRTTSYSAGRPRCNDCHADYLDALATGQLHTTTPRPTAPPRAA